VNSQASSLMRALSCLVGFLRCGAGCFVLCCLLVVKWLSLSFVLVDEELSGYNGYN
jgi:hypothetical protein